MFLLRHSSSVIFCECLMSDAHRFIKYNSFDTMSENKSEQSANRGSGGKPHNKRSSKGKKPGKKSAEKKDDADAQDVRIQNLSQRKEADRSNDHRRSANGRGNGNRNRNGNQNRGGNRSEHNNIRGGRDGGKTQYPKHITIDECLTRYTSNDAKLARGKLRTIAGGGMAFVSCDRGSYRKDILIDGELGRNRSLDGDLVFVEIIGPVSERGNSMQNNDKKTVKALQVQKISVNDFMEKMTLTDDVRDVPSKDISQEEKASSGIENKADGIQYEDYEAEAEESVESEDGAFHEDELETWQDDEIQCDLWNPVVNIPKRKNNGQDITTPSDDEEQFYGRVINIVPPKASSGKQASELSPSDENFLMSNARRTIVGTISKANQNSSRYLFVPNSRSLPRFMAPAGTKPQEGKNEGQLYRADYVYGSWSASDKWPPCINLKAMGQSANVEDETQALLLEFGVDHGDFGPEVLRDVESSVKSGRFQEEGSSDLGWKPTPEMYEGRRDYRKERIFTIDPTTAKDLDDALHIKQLPDGRVEIGVHIADVSHFLSPGTHVDEEAARRTTTVYLVDRVIPMLPRPLCEIACSLNENVERLAFSCVWTMNMDGTLAKKKSKGGKASQENDVWYGRTVIKSCSRLDYATAQNIIDGKVATGEQEPNPLFWPKSRQPTGGHSIDKVAADVRLMHKVAMARRALRFQNGALALNGIKLTFQMGEDRKTPSLCEPYPIRDSNRLIEEYMLIANYLVAQRLITHAGGLAVLRQHMPPLNQGLQSVIDIAAERGFEIDGTTSQTLQESLSRMSRECDDKLTMQCITELIMTPMRPAEYIAAGQFEAIDWAHFALNIPYYTHFTSPIRRYPDVLVHRLLQATLDGKDAVDAHPQTEEEIQTICMHCNEKRMASKKAQERSDRIFLSIFLKSNPILSTLGVVVSVGERAFTVFIPSIGMSGLVYLDEHSDIFEARVTKDEQSGQRSMFLVPKIAEASQIDIKIFTKLAIACHCKDDPPIDVKLRIVGPWEGP